TGGSDIDAVCGKSAGDGKQRHKRNLQQSLQEFGVHCSVPLLFLPRIPLLRTTETESNFVLTGLPGGSPGSPRLGVYRVIVTPEVTIPPALDRIVVSGGGGTLVNRIVKTPVANGITGPISPVYGCPFAGLIVGLSPFGPARVTNNRTP